MSDVNSKLALHPHYMQHCNVPNRTIFCRDNIDVLQSINSKSVDLIYLDPPFAKNETFVGNNEKVQEIKKWFINLQDRQGLFADVDFNDVFKESVRFSDIWDDTDIQREHYSQIDTYNHELINYFNSIKTSTTTGGFYYLIFMTIRLIEMHRILKDTGSMYLHCDPTTSHYLKVILDKIFGVNNFRNEIVWGYRTGGVSKKRLPRKHDIILLYGKSKAVAYNPLKETIAYEKPFFTDKEPDENGKYPVEVYVRDVWDDEIKPVINVSKERVGYPTQKPLTLLERIIKLSSNEGDVVLDPFCGCATTCVAAEKLGRHWIGIDWNAQAYYMIYYRAHMTGLITAEQLFVFDQKLRVEREPLPRTDKIEGTPFYEVKSKEELKKKKHGRQMDPQYRKEAIDLLYEEQSGICTGCDAYLRKADLTVDHIIPRDKEGTHDIDNLQLLCYRCNNWKRTGTMAELVQTLYEKNIIPIGVAKKQMKLYHGTLKNPPLPHSSLAPRGERASE